MLYPIIIKKILERIRISYEDIILTKENHRDYKEYSNWLSKYFELSETDKINIIKKFERSQTASIIYAMRRRDREIFINQLGVFYIKQTTLDFYKSINDNINEDGSNFKEIKQSALEECRELFIKRSNIKKNAKQAVKINIKK